MSKSTERTSRRIARRRLLSIVTIGTLSLVAALTEIGVAMHGGILRATFGVDDPSSVVTFLGLPLRADLSPSLEGVRAAQGVFSEVSSFQEGPVNVVAAGEAAELHGVQVSDRYFSVLGVAPMRGRWPAGDPARLEAVISDRVWRRFYGQTEAVGQQIRVNGHQLTIVAVANELDYPAGAAIWIPVGIGNDTMVGESVIVWGIGRVKQGASLSDAAKTLRSAGLDDRTEVEPIGSRTRLRVAPVVNLITKAVLVILSLAFVTVVFLRTSFIVDTFGDLQTRISLGARWHQLVLEHSRPLALFGIVGGTVGVIAGQGIWGVVLTLLPRSVPAPPLIGGWAALSGFGAAVGTSLLGGLLPLAGGMVRREALSVGVRSRATIERAGGTVFSVLVAVQVTVAMCLGGVGSQLLASALREARIDRGFVPEHIGVSEVVLAKYRYRTGSARLQFYNRLLDGLKAHPALGGVAAVSAPPYSIRPNAILPVGLDSIDAPKVGAMIRVVTPGYFRVMRARLVSGRDFGNSDASGAPLVAVVSESLVKRLSLGKQALGARLRVPGSSPNVEVVGIVRDLADPVELATGASSVYLALQQRPRGSMAVVARSVAGERTAEHVVRGLVKQIDPEQPVSGFRPLKAMIAQASSRERLATLSVVSLAVIALAIASLGLFASTSRYMRTRLHELGLRAAVGATPTSLAAHFLEVGCRPVLVGVAFGCAGSVWASSLVRHSWPGLVDWDPQSLAIMAGILAASGVASVAIPVWHAVRASPAIVFRAVE